MSVPSRFVPTNLPDPCGAHRLARALKRHGVQVLFGQSLPSALHLVIGPQGMRQIAYRQENAGAAMADGYARACQKVAVVTAQNGPAAALLAPGLAEALKASIPIVAIVQDVRRNQTDRNAFQELDHVDIFRGCAKWVRRVSEMSRIEDYVDMAFTAAASARPGPAVLLIPQDLLIEPTVIPTGEVRVLNLGYFPLDRPQADFAQIKRAAQWIAKAQHPLIVAGGGVHISEAHRVLAAIQQEAALPVGTTSMGKGSVAETHPLSIGVMGYFMGQRGMSRHMLPLIREADCIIFVGNRTNQNGTDSWTLFPPGARYIHIDIDPQEVGRNYEALRLVGDAKLTLEALRIALLEEDLTKRQASRPALEHFILQGKKAFMAESRSMRESEATPIRPERVMQVLNDLINVDTLIVTDASYASIWAMNYLVAQKPGSRFFSGRGLAGLGWGFAAAIGVKVAKPHQEVVCIVGDGGFAHMWSELETVARMGIKITVLVLNNQILGYQWHAEEALYGAHTEACQLAPVDHALIANACGCVGIRVTDPAQIRPALLQSFDPLNVKTHLIDLMIDPQAYPPITLFEGRF